MWSMGRDEAELALRPARRVRAGEGTRTPDLLFTRQLLYQLSYSGTRTRAGV